MHGMPSFLANGGGIERNVPNTAAAEGYHRIHSLANYVYTSLDSYGLLMGSLTYIAERNTFPTDVYVQFNDLDQSFVACSQDSELPRSLQYFWARHVREEGCEERTSCLNTPTHVKVS